MPLSTTRDRVEVYVMIRGCVTHSLDSDRIRQVTDELPSAHIMPLSARSFSTQGDVKMQRDVLIVNNRNACTASARVRHA